MVLEYDDENSVSGVGEVGEVARVRLRDRVLGWWGWAWRLLLCWLVGGSAVWLCGGWSRGVDADGGELSARVAWEGLCRWTACCCLAC